MKAFVCLLLLLQTALPLYAQTDSLTLADTIGLKSRLVFLSRIRQYRYYGADNLTERQLARLLRQSPAAEARQLARSSLTLRKVAGGMMATGSAAFLASVGTIVKKPELSSSLFVVSFGGVYGALLPQGMGNRRVRRARELHNFFVRSRAGAYFNPAFEGSPDAVSPTLADTVTIRRPLLFYRFTYRKVPVHPAYQLTRLIDQLAEPDVQNRMRYSRTVRGIGGFVGGVGVSFMTIYALSLAASQNFSRNGYRINPRIPAIAFGGLGLGLLIRFHGAQAEARALERYNELLRETSR